MTTSHFANSRQVQRQLLTLLASTTILTAGCSNMISTASSSGPANAEAITLSGHIKGGNQPVSGAAVSLYFAGQGPGLPSAATLVATTTSANDGYGSFSFTRGADGGTNSGTTSTFSCPTSVPNGSPYVFVVARGGNTLNDGSSNVNNDSVFIAPFGRCGSIGASTFVNMSEVVTAATVVAVHQYMNPSATHIETSIGADGIYVSNLALANSFDNVRNLVNLSTGLAVATSTSTGSANGASGVTVTIAPEQAKLNHVADILSSCVNNATSGSAACNTLYNYAVPASDLSTTSVPNATAGRAADVLQAAYYIFSNPTNRTTANLAGLYNIPAAVGSPYMPRLTTQPTDWTIGINYTTANTCSDTTTSPANFLTNPFNISIDQSGDVWFANNQAGSGSLAALSPAGVPLSCYTLATGTGTPVAGAGAQSSVVDTAGNIWVGSARSSDIYRYTPGTTGTVITAFTGSPVLSLTADGYGNVYYANSAGNIYELQGAATSPIVPVGFQVNSTSVGTATKIMIDTNNVIWASSGANYVTGTTVQPSSIVPSLGVTVTYSMSTPSYAVAATRLYGPQESGGPGVYVSSNTGDSLEYLLSTGSIAAVASGGGINQPVGIALDGAQNVWAANLGSSGLSEFSRAGVALSPANTGFQKTTPGGVNGQRSIAIDSSGNVWTGINNANTITEIVGAAVPVYQPFALGLPPQNGVRFQTIP